jgi:hypothetical protein
MTHNTPTPVSLYFRNTDIVEEATVDGEASHDTIEHMASFITLRVGMAMLRRQLKKQKESQQQQVSSSQSPLVADAEQEKHSLLHKKEGDRNLALGDEFASTPDAKAAATATMVRNSNMPTCIASDFGKPLDVLQDKIPPMQVPIAKVVQIQKDESKDSASAATAVVELESSPAAEVSIPVESTDSNSAVDAGDVVVSKVILPSSVVPDVIATDFGKPLDVLQDGSVTSAVVDAAAAVSETTAPDAVSTARAALAETADKVDTSSGDSSNVISPSATPPSTTSGATATNTAANDDLIAKYFVYPSDGPGPAAAAETKSNVSWKERSTFGATNRDTSGLQMAMDESAVLEAAAPMMETKEFDAFELITQESFREQIRYENVDMAKARRVDETLELSTDESSKEPAMAARTEVKLDTKSSTSKKAEKKRQNDKMKPATGFGKTKRAIGSQERESFGKDKENSKTLRGGTESKKKIRESVSEEVSRASVTPTESAPVFESSSFKASIVSTDTVFDADVPEVMIPPSGVPTPVKTKKSKYGKKQGPSSTASSPVSVSSTTDTVSTPTLAVTIDETDTSSGDSHVVLSQSIVTPQALDSLLVVETKKASSEEAKHRALLMARLEQERRLMEKVVEHKKASSEEAKDRALLMARLQQEQQQRETPDRQSAVTLARKQPKSPEEEKRLQECYGGMLLEERAHAILYDLGMIEKNLDPNDPDYDHSNDNEVSL